MWHGANMTLKIGIIGGSGIADAGFFEEVERKELETPFGSPSGPYIIGKSAGLDVIFLPRHGIGHKIPPHGINYRANIWGMRELGVSKILAPSAVGSLREDFRPGEICIADQFIDWTRGRELTFFDGPEVVHVGVADPYCSSLRGMLAGICGKKEIPHHKEGTLVVIAGPRFSTKAESRMFRNFADIIGMTGVPEAQLARELGLCYANLSMITDYDVWAEKPVNTAEVIRTMQENVGKIQVIIEESIKELAKGRECEECSAHLDDAGF